MTSATARVSDPVGFHLRAAGRIVKLTKSFASEVTIRYEGRVANAKSIMGLASLAAEFGTLEVGDKGPKSLAHACALQPRFATGAFGKPEAVLLFSDLALDCTALLSRSRPDSGPFEPRVEGNSRALLSISFQKGLQPGRVSVYGPGFTLGDDACTACTLVAKVAADRIQGSAATSM